MLNGPSRILARIGLNGSKTELRVWGLEDLEEPEQGQVKETPLSPPTQSKCRLMLSFLVLTGKALSISLCS